MLLKYALYLPENTSYSPSRNTMKYTHQFPPEFVRRNLRRWATTPVSAARARELPRLQARPRPSSRDRMLDPLLFTQGARKVVGERLDEISEGCALSGADVNFHWHARREQKVASRVRWRRLNRIDRYL